MHKGKKCYLNEKPGKKVGANNPKQPKKKGY